MTDPRPMLTRLGLQHYIEVFVQEGFETWESILDITESDLDALKVKLGHRRILQRHIASVRGLRFDSLTSLNSPSQSHKSPESCAATADEGNQPHGPESGPRQKRRYRRHPKPDENAPERPPSAYVLFSNKVRDDLKPLSLSFTEIAKRVGESWQVLSPNQKEPYETQAVTSKERYNREMASYKMNEMYRNHQRYLADFRAKHGNHIDEQHPQLEHELSNAGNSSAAKGPEGSRNPASRPNPCGRRLEPVGPNIPGSVAEMATSPSGSLPSQGSGLSKSTSGGTSGSAAPLASPSSMASSSSLMRLNLEQQEPNIFSEKWKQHLPRIAARESGSPSRGNMKADVDSQRSLQPRRSPSRSADQIPRCLHQSSSHTSDSSNPSVTSSQSSKITATTSLSGSKGSEDDGKPNLVLPPISSLTGVPREVAPLEIQSGRADLATPASAAYASYRARPSLLRTLPGTKTSFINFDSQKCSCVKPDCLNMLIVQDSNADTHSPQKLSLQSSGIETHPDPLSVLAEAAHAGSIGQDIASHFKPSPR